jgi:hypothetical protein
MKPADSESHIFGSGLDGYPWWRGMERIGWKVPEEFPFDAPDDWVWRVTVDVDHEADDHGRVTTVDVDHEKVMGVFRRVGAAGIDPQQGDSFMHGVSRSTVKQCGLAVIDPDNDHLGFDAASADEVLQLVVFGAVLYG